MSDYTCKRTTNRGKIRTAGMTVFVPLSLVTEFLQPQRRDPVNPNTSPTESAEGSLLAAVHMWLNVVNWSPIEEDTVRNQNGNKNIFPSKTFCSRTRKCRKEIFIKIGVVFWWLVMNSLKRQFEYGSYWGKRLLRADITLLILVTDHVFQGILTKIVFSFCQRNVFFVRKNSIIQMPVPVITEKCVWRFGSVHLPLSLLLFLRFIFSKPKSNRTQWLFRAQSYVVTGILFVSFRVCIYGELFRESRWLPSAGHRGYFVHRSANEAYCL